MSRIDVWLTLGPAILLTFVHIWAPLIRPEKLLPQTFWLSFADGISITFVVLQLLPEAGHIAGHLPEALHPVHDLLSHYPYLPMLVSLVTFYGIEKVMERPATPDQQGGSNLTPLRIWIYMAGYALYKVVVGYLLAKMLSPIAVLVFSVAMAMHFFVVDFHLVNIHRNVFAGIGRWALSAAFLAGWGVGVATKLSPFVVALLMSFVSGGAMMMMIQEEFSEKRPTSFPGFLLGVVMYSALLFMLVRAA
jgi:hypothetical protein